MSYGVSYGAARWARASARSTLDEHDDHVEHEDDVEHQDDVEHHDNIEVLRDVLREVLREQLCALEGFDPREQPGPGAATQLFA